MLRIKHNFFCSSDISITSIYNWSSAAGDLNIIWDDPVDCSAHLEICIDSEKKLFGSLNFQYIDKSDTNTMTFYSLSLMNFEGKLRAIISSPKKTYSAFIQCQPDIEEILKNTHALNDCINHMQDHREDYSRIVMPKELLKKIANLMFNFVAMDPTHNLPCKKGEDHSNIKNENFIDFVKSINTLLHAQIIDFNYNRTSKLSAKPFHI